MWLPAEDKFNMRKYEVLDNVVVAMGGRVAEEIVFGDVTSGARGDIKMATGLARRMVCEWGMSEKLGMVEYGDHEDYVFLGRELGRQRDYSEETARQIDSEVKRICDEGYERANKIISDNRDKLEAIAKGLLEFETLDASHIMEIMEHGKMMNPPAPPPSPGDEAEEEEKTSSEKKSSPEIPPGGLTEAPAGT